MASCIEQLDNFIETLSAKVAMADEGEGNVVKKKFQPVTILDGGMGHLLRRMGVKIQGKVGELERFLNVATSNVTNPMLVERAHLEYLKAGAQVITTNSYACIPNVLTKTKIDRSGEKPTFTVGSEDYAVNKTVITHEDIKKYIQAAGKCASNAKRIWNTEKTTGAGENIFNEQCKVAASIPPLQASYRYDLVESQEVLRRDYAFITETIEPYVDIFLCETMSSIEEGVAAGAAASRFNKPVWISFTLSEYKSQLGLLRSGETMEDAVRECVEKVGSNLKAILCNCSSIESINVAIPNIVNALVALGQEDIEVGAYANGFEATDEFIEELEDAECNIEKLAENINVDIKIRDEYKKDMTPDAYFRACKVSV